MFFIFALYFKSILPWINAPLHIAGITVPETVPLLQIKTMRDISQFYNNPRGVSFAFTMTVLVGVFQPKKCRIVCSPLLMSQSGSEFPDSSMVQIWNGPHSTAGNNMKA